VRMRLTVVMRFPLVQHDIQAGFVGIADQDRALGTAGVCDPINGSM
jgi:hypothetical protein